MREIPSTCQSKFPKDYEMSFYKRPKMKKFMSIAELIPQVVYNPPKNTKLHYEVGLRNIHEKWSEIVGQLLAKKTQPITIKSKVLWVETLGSSWAQELNLLKLPILEKIKTLFPKINVSDIKFQSVTRLRGSSG